MRGICKRFPGVVALDRVNLTVREGEVVGLVGENGAGKTTLMNVLDGIHRPDEGEIRIDGRLAHIRSVGDATRLGIGFIHQELNILDNIDVAGNVFLGREPLQTPFGLINRDRIHTEAKAYLDRLGLHVSTHTVVRDLTLAQQQLVEIAKALSLNARILIMDEPTSSLTLSESQRLLTLVTELKEQGVSIIYISHRLAEIRLCADRVVVLRDGRNTGCLARGDIDHDRMVRLMVGRDLNHAYVPACTERQPALFRVRHLRSSVYPQEAVSLDAAGGEILGLAGLVGAGRSALAQAVFGIGHVPDGEVFLGDERLDIRRASDAVAHGIYLVPEDRGRDGLVTEMVVRENITLPSLSNYARGFLVDRARERSAAEDQAQRLDIRAPGIESPVSTLSGGNQQKVVLAKWLNLDPKVMIFDEPTRGIDVGAKAEIYAIMRALARTGTVIIMISSDMEEVLTISDRVAVMHEGRITGVLDRPHCTEETIMRLAVGDDVPAANPAVHSS